MCPLRVVSTACRDGGMPKKDEVLLQAELKSLPTYPLCQHLLATPEPSQKLKIKAKVQSHLGGHSPVGPAHLKTTRDRAQGTGSWQAPTGVF